MTKQVSIKLSLISTEILRIFKSYQMLKAWHCRGSCCSWHVHGRTIEPSCASLAVTELAEHSCDAPWHAYHDHHADGRICCIPRPSTCKASLHCGSIDGSSMHQHDRIACHTLHSHNDAHHDESSDADKRLNQSRNACHKLCWRIFKFSKF